MPEEYVYKIVVDDGDVSTALDRIDQKVVSLTNKMDGMFRAVGAGAAAPARQAAQQVEQSAQRMGQAQVRAARQTQQASQQTTQQVVRGQQQVDQARRQSISVMDQEIQKAGDRRRVAKENADAQRQALEAEVRGLEQAQARREQMVSQRSAGVSIISETDVGREAALGEDISARTAGVAAGEAGVSAAEQELQASSEAYDQLVEGRQAASEQITGIVEQEADAVVVSSSRASQASVEQARVQVESARQMVQSKQGALQTLEAAEAQAKAQTLDAANVEREKKRVYEDTGEAVKRASEEQATAREDLKNVSKEASEGEKQALKDTVEAKKQASATATEAHKTAKEEYTTSKRQTEDLASKEKAVAAERKTASAAVTQAVKNERKAKQQLKTESSKLAKQNKLNAKEQRDAERMFIRTTKTFGKQRAQLDQLARKYGSFKVTLGKTTDELDEHEKEVYEVIKGDKQLGQEIDKLTAKYGKFDAQINRSSFAGGPQVGVPKTAYRQAGFALGRAGVPGAATLGEAATVGGLAGVAVVGVIASVRELINAFKTLASAAVNAFKQIVSSSAEAAKEIEVARAQFSAFFQQDTVAAEAALKRLQQLSVSLGENVVGIGRAFLPEVESLDQLEDIVKIAVALARFQPEQGILGARIALQEFLAGETRSLQRRFEISPVAIDKMRDALNAGGVTAGLASLQEELERTGRSVEDLADTFSVSLGRIQERFRQLRQDIGEPIIEEVADQFDAIDEALAELEPDLTIIGTAFGEVTARLAEMIGVAVTDFLESFDPEPLLEVVEASNRVVGALGVVFEVLADGKTSAEKFGGSMNFISINLLRLETFILRVGLRLATFRNQMAEDAESYIKIYRPLIDILQLASKLAPEGTGAITAPIEMSLQLVEDALNELEDMDIEPFDWEAAMVDNAKAIEQLGFETEDMLNQLHDIDRAGDDAADSFLNITKSLEQLVNIQDRYAETQEKVNEAIKEFNIQAALRFEKILTDATRKRLEYEIQAAQKTVDIERKNRQKLADIRTKYTQSVLDAAQDLVDKEAEIMRKHGYAVLDLEDDRNKKRLEAEEKYLDALEKLRDKYNFQAFEAMLANDAKQLRQIRRRQAFEESQLGKDKDRNLRDIDQDIDYRRNKLDESLRREIEAVRIANAQKLRDLADSLDQQLAKQEEARRRELEQQGIAEKRKRDQLDESLRQQIEDYGTWWDERYRVTSEGIASELEQMQGLVDNALGILAQLESMGVVFDPITGEPRFATDRPTIAEPESPELKALTERTAATIKAAEVVTGEGDRSLEEIRESLEGLEIGELVDRLADASDSLGAVFDRDKLERDVLTEQAIFLAGQVGISKEEVLGELPQSLKFLQEWIDDFVAEYSVRTLPEISIFGDAPQGPPGLLEMVNPMREALSSLLREQLPAAEEFSEEAWFAGIDRLVSSLNLQELIGALKTAQEVGGGIGIDPSLGRINQLITALESQQATAAETGDGAIPADAIPVSPYAGAVTAQPGQEGISGPDLWRVPPAVPGQTQFVFPGVTQAPYLIPEGADVGGGVPGFGQLMAGAMTGTGVAGEDFYANLFQPQAFMAGSPTAGFDLDEWQQQLNDQVTSQAIAELAKRGEIEDTVAFAELLLEKENLAIAGLLGEQTYEYQTATDEQVAMLEDVMQRHQANLDQMRQDPDLGAQVESTETALGVLGGVLEQAYADREAANAALIAAEAISVEDSEKKKLEVIKKAAQDQVATVGLQESQKSEVVGEARSLEVEAHMEHMVNRQESEAEGLDNEIKILDKHFKNFLKYQKSFMDHDIDLLQWWLLQRQTLIEQSISQLPTLPGTPGLPGDPDDTGDATASLADLQNLAIQQSQDAGLYDQDTHNEIMTMTYDQLLDFIDYLQNLLGYALGGGHEPGVFMVGEGGHTEIMRTGSAGRIDVFKDLLFRSTPPVNVGGTSNIDNSTNLGGFSVPDPRGLPISYVKQVENMISNAIVQAWGNKIT